MNTKTISKNLIGMCFKLIFLERFYHFFTVDTYTSWPFNAIQQYRSHWFAIKHRNIGHQKWVNYSERSLLHSFRSWTVVAKLILATFFVSMKLKSNFMSAWAWHKWIKVAISSFFRFHSQSSNFRGHGVMLFVTRNWDWVN